MSLDARRPEDIDDAAVRTLAELIYECGFGPDLALAMARSLAELPSRGQDW